MIDWKMALRRRRKIIALASLIVALVSAVLAIFILASPLVPPSTVQVRVPIPSPRPSISYYQGYLFQWITFQTLSLEANTTYYGNVTLCCLNSLPTGSGRSTYLNTPDVIVFSESEYIAMKGTQYGNPLNSGYEVSIPENTLRNYTLNGEAGTEVLSIQFAPKYSSVYYFVVGLRNGETQGHLYLTYYKSQIVENPSVYHATLILAVFAVAGLFVNAIEKYLTFRTPDDRN